MSYLLKARHLVKKYIFLLFDLLIICIPIPRRDFAATVIRLDAIGDFLIWLQFGAKEINEYLNDNFAGRTLLICNDVNLEIAKQIGYWDEIFPINIIKIKRNLLYRLKTLLSLKRFNFQIAIQPRHAREMILDDSVIRICNAKHKLVSQFSSYNISELEGKIGNLFASQLIEINKKAIKHEIDYSQEITFNITNKKVSKTNLAIFLSSKNLSPNNIIQVESYDLIIHPTSGWHGRNWPHFNFSEFISKIQDNWPNLKIGFLGSSNDHAVMLSINSLLKEKHYPEVKIIYSQDLIHSLQLIKAAKIFIGNESGLAHAGIALNTPTICFLGGGHYNWFAPYPEEYHDKRTIFLSTKMDCFNCNWNCIYEIKKNNSAKCIENISVTSAYHAFYELYENTKKNDKKRIS